MGATINNKVNSNRTTALERTANSATGGGGGGLNAFYWHQIFALCPVVVKHRICSLRIEAFYLMQCMNTDRKSKQINTSYDENKERGHDSQIFRAEENFKYVLKKVQVESRLVQL